MVVVTATGVKVGSKGRVANTPEKVGSLLGTMSKSEARKVRKALFASGKRRLASVAVLE
jgi:hypothetical protein